MGIAEILVVFVIILLLFGGSRLPGLARGLGQGIRNFKDANRSSKDGSGDDGE